MPFPKKTVICTEWLYLLIENCVLFFEENWNLKVKDVFAMNILIVYINTYNSYSYPNISSCFV